MATTRDKAEELAELLIRLWRGLWQALAGRGTTASA